MSFHMAVVGIANEGICCMATRPINTESWKGRRRIAGDLALRGDIAAARRALSVLAQDAESIEDRASILSDLAAVAAASGRIIAADRGLQRALRLSPECKVAERNLSLLRIRDTVNTNGNNSAPRRPRIAILSLLFNWPSTGGGTVHTKELADALQTGGYEVRHIYAVHEAWGVGKVTEPLSVPVTPLMFSDSEWNAESIQDRFRGAVDEFAPDGVIITDTWNTKPLLAEAVADYPYFLRLAALETICPLNNVRLLFEDGCLVQCLQDQLSSPQSCRQCVKKFAHYSGGLHQAERAIAGFDDDDYTARLHRANRGAEAVLVVNPEIAETVRPFCRRVEVIPSGFDPQRFPEPEFHDAAATTASTTRFIFAGLVDEPMKGFSTLFRACEQLWEVRQDFELLVTSAQHPDWDAPFIRWIGWQTQSELPSAISAADVLVFPTIAQEALGRTAVEAMGCGRPVIASRLGGLPWVVEDEVTGLIVTPGDASDLAHKMTQCMDDANLRQQLGRAGREKFQREFPWRVILETHYRPLFRQLVAESLAAP